MKKRKYSPPEEESIRMAITGDIGALYDIRAHYDKLMRFKLNKEIRIMVSKYDIDPGLYSFDDILGDMGIILDNAVMNFKD